MKDDDFKLLRGFEGRQTNRQTDICECRVAFATEKALLLVLGSLCHSKIVILY